jgi:cation:H+ antiporter
LLIRKGRIIQNIINIIILCISIYLLWKGAELLVESAAKIANYYGISELVIGLTVVSMGTSAPEFAVSFSAALKNIPSISIGNIVGSNIFNLGFILGTVAIIKPVKTNKIVVYRDGIFLIFVTLLLLFFSYNSTLNIISRIEGIIFLLLLFSYLFYLFYKKESLPFDNELDEIVSEKKNITSKDYIILFAGMFMIFLGGKLLVDSASALATTIGVSDWVIAVTVVAAGTSAPEFVTSLVAVLKGKSNISIGNLIGSDIFNLLGVLGLTAFIRPLAVNEPMALLSLIMLSFMVIIVFFFMKSNWVISRKEGIMLVALGLFRWLLDFTL